jgi:transketolase
VAHFRAHIGRRGEAAHAAWKKLFAAYRAQYPDLAEQIDRMRKREAPTGWDVALPTFAADAKGLATRDSSGQVLNAIAAHMPWLLGGAADLSPSTKTDLEFDFADDFQAPEGEQAVSYRGRNFHFGLREHAMCAIGSGMSLSRLRPFVSSFLIFTDYCRAALRLSSMMELPLISIWTHDSISLGEDGPTHQPIEQIASFRAMPGMVVLRPADANEVVEAWRVIMRMKDRPVCLLLTRQAVPTFDRSIYASAEGVSRGAYVMADAVGNKPDVLLLATGSEVALCVTAYEELKADGIKARVVSMPSWELFENQPREYRDIVLPPAITARVAVEKASGFGWERYTGFDGAVLAMDSFGLSAPSKVVAKHFGFEPALVVAAAKAQIAERRSAT